jgi:hypothetical protein
MAETKKTRDDTESQNKASDTAAAKAAEDAEKRNDEVRAALKTSNDPPRTTASE